MKKNAQYKPIVQRLDSVVESSEEKSVNTFAKNVLHYSASEKLSRVFRDNVLPSIDVVIDFKKAFPDLDLNWLITGKGSMFPPLIDSVQNSLDAVRLSEPDYKTLYENLQHAVNEYFNSRDALQKLAELPALPHEKTEIPLDEEGGTTGTLRFESTKNKDK